MKTISKVLAIFFILTIPMNFISCKKDYPDDIPKWIISYIQDRKEKKGRFEDTGYPHREVEYVTIKEYIYKNKDKIYEFSSYVPTGGAPIFRPTVAFYDYDGNKLCIVYEDWYSQVQNTGTCPCGSIDLKDVVESRIIWNEQI